MATTTNQQPQESTTAASQDIATSYNAALAQQPLQNQQQPMQAGQQSMQSQQQPMQAGQQSMQSQQQPTQSGQQSMQSNAQPAGTGQAKAIIGIFRDLSAAEQSVTELRNSGFTTEEINIVSKEPSPGRRAYGDDSVMDGTMTGGAIGGIGGLLLSAGALTIPGLGPIIAAGPLAATIAGAIGGGVTGGLIDWGIPSAKSEEYNDEVSSGKTLAVIKTPENKVAQAVQILTAHGAMNIETHNV